MKQILRPLILLVALLVSAPCFAQGSVQTIGATTATCDYFTPPEGAAMATSLRYLIVGLTADGTAAVYYQRIGLFIRTGQTIVQVGLTDGGLADIESAGLVTANAAYDIAGVDIRVRVTGVLGATLHWVCKVERISL